MESVLVIDRTLCLIKSKPAIHKLVILIDSSSQCVFGNYLLMHIIQIHMGDIKYQLFFHILTYRTPHSFFLLKVYTYILHFSFYSMTDFVNNKKIDYKTFTS